MRTPFFVQLLFSAVLLWQSAVAQTSLPPCTASLVDHDNDGVAAAVDVDKDNDGLIEICDIEGIDEMRHQLDGSSYTTSTDAVNITQGCPTTGCQGYELMQSLDFNAAASYRTTSNKVIWTTAPGWQPIGSDANRFSSIFDGNGFTIRNLLMDREESDLGLFSVLDTAGEIKNIGLLNVSVEGTDDVGALVGQNYGSIINSYITGTVKGDNNIGGLVGLNNNRIINSYATVTVIGTSRHAGGLVGLGDSGSIINSYATGKVKGDLYIGGLVARSNLNSSIINSYAAAMVSSGYAFVGGLISFSKGLVVTSYWDTETSGRARSSGGVAKTKAELQSPTVATGIYSNWSSDDWDFGGNNHYPALRYAKGDNLNACVDITTSSEALPCGIMLPNQSDRNTGLAGIFFFADGEPTEVVLDPLFSQGIDHYDMTIVASNLDIHLRPYALNDSAKITISDRGNPNYFTDKPNGALSDAISLEDNETTLTIVVTDNMNEVPTTYTFVIVRLLPLRVDISRSRFSVILEPAISNPDGGGFSYQWQQQAPGGSGWTDIPAATTATYSLPADADGRIRYRVIIWHTDGGDYITDYPTLGPFKASVDNDGDGLIDIYALEDLNAIRYQLDGRAYKANENADPLMLGCPVTGCKGYELMQSLDFNAAASYYTTSNKAIWTTGRGWQPIGSDDNRFSSIFEGNGYTISNLFMDREGVGLGLFSVLHANGEIKNIGLLNISVTGRGSNIGSMVGQSFGGIINSYAMGTVTATRGDNIGGLVGESHGSIINSYAMGTVTVTMGDDMGGLVGESHGSIINSYAMGVVDGSSFVGGLVGQNHALIINSYATGVVDGSSFVGGLIGRNYGGTISSYWDTQTSGQTSSDGGVAKITAELQSPTEAVGIYNGWSSNNWDFGDSDHYPVLRYATNGNLNACTNNITTSSEVLPCGITLPNQRDRSQGLAGIFFFADGEPAEIVLDPLFSQGIDNYAMTIVASNLNIHLRPYALNDSAKITISDQYNPNYFANKPNGALSDAIGLKDSETTLTIVVTDTINEVSVNTTYTFAIVRLLPIRVDVSRSRLSVIFESDDPYPDGGVFSYQWQQQMVGTGWTDIADATTATYWSPAAADGRIRYRVINIKYTSRDRYIINYPNQEPFRLSADDDGDGLIDIYTLEDLNAIRYQPNGRAYQSNRNAEPLMQGCPVTGCKGYELMQSLDFNANASYYTISNKAIWTTGGGWQSIGSNANRFSGIFEGNGFTIRNLLIRRVGSNLGLLSVLDTTGEIKNVGLLNISVRGRSGIGGLVGQNYGSIINSYATGAVTGTSDNIGGLVGQSFGGIINSYAMVNITGISDANGIGGLVGMNSGSITNSYATGTVTGRTKVNNMGGLVGVNQGSITNSYAIGTVTGTRGNNMGGLVGFDSDGSVIASYWNAETSNQLTNAGSNGVTSATTAQLQSPTTPGTTTTEVYYLWSANDWDFGDDSHYPALRYAADGNLNACTNNITTSSTVIPCGILLPNQSSRDQGLAGVFFFADGEPTEVMSDPLFFQRIYSYNKIIVTTKTAVQLTLRPYALNANATITITDQDNEDYFVGKPNGALSDPIMLSDPTTLTLVVTDTINEVLVNTTYTVTIKREIPLVVSAITLSLDPATPIDEGDTITLTFDVSGGSGRYEYTYLLDGQPLPSPSQSPFEFTLATDIVAADFTTQTVKFTIRVNDDDGHTFEHSEDLTINKVNNGDPVITLETSSKYLRIIFSGSDADGEGDVSLQWQSQMPSGAWMDIVGATTPTYYLPTSAESSIRYRAVNISYTDGQGHFMKYNDQVLFLGETMLMSNISGAKQANEGETLILTAATLNGGGQYNYTWTHTVEDNTQLSGYSDLTLTGTTATVQVAIPVDFIASATTSANIIFKVVVDDGLTMTSSSKVVTINKIDNGVADIATTEVNAILSVTVNSDPDGDATTPNYAYQWQQRAPVADSQWMDINTATAATYQVPSETPIDTHFSVLVTYTDRQGYRETVASNEIAYLPHAIEAMEDTSRVAQANEGNTITFTAPPLNGGGQYNYTWTHTVEDDTQLSGDSDLTLTGTTATVHVAIPADFIALTAISATITFKVVVDDGLSMTSQSIVVAIHKIDNGVANITITRMSSTLTVTVNPDPDGDATDPNYTYQWQQRAPGADSQWMDINTTAAATYIVPDETPIDTGFRVSVTYTDRQGYRETVASNEIAYIPHMMETMGDISVAAQANEGDTLTITAPTLSGGGQYNYTWTYTAEDDTQLSGDSALTLTGTTATVRVAIPADFIALTATSTTITFKVVVDDGLSMIRQSIVVTIHKIDNGVANITITRMSSTLTVTVNPDPDGDATDPNYAYQWQQRAPGADSQWMDINTTTAATYIVPDETPIDTGFRVSVTYTDRQGYRETVASNEIAYIPHMMETMGDSSGAIQVNEGGILILTAPTVSGGSGEYHYEWTQTAEDSTQLSGHSALTLSITTTTLEVAIPANFIALAATSATITFKVVVIDDEFTTSQSIAVTIHKIDNGLADMAITEMNGTLSVTVNPDSDPDGNATTPNYVYQWQQHAPGADSQWQDINDATTATYSVPSDTLVDTGFRVLVTYTDGQGYRKTRASHEIRSQFSGLRIRTKVFLEGPLR